MKIVTGKSPIQITGPDVTLVLADSGGAHVSMELSIEGLPPMHHDETYKGAKSTTVQLRRGRTYKCDVFIAAYKYGALNAVYDSTVTANGILLAHAKGAIPSGKASEMALGRFTLKVS